MKKFLPFLLVFFYLISCSEEDDYVIPEKDSTQESTEEKAAIGNTEIKGVIKGATGEKLQFFYVDQSTMKPGGTIELNEDGEFFFNFPMKNLNLLQFVIGTESIALAFNKDESVPFLTAQFPGMDTNFNVSNSTNSDLLKQYYHEVSSYKNFMKSRGTALQQMGQVKDSKDSLYRVKVIDSLFKQRSQIETIARKYIAKDYANPINQILVTDIYPTYGFKQWAPENLDVGKEMALAYQEKYPGEDFTKKMQQDIVSWENQYAAHQKFEKRVAMYGDFSQKIAIGSPAPDIILDDPNGNELRLSSLKGKTVLIDFWASWCGPCRKENPNVVRMYNAYKDKGFTVYSVSLDNNRDKWLQAIQQDGLSWPNHVSDLSGWNTPLTKVYKFNGIPFTVLVDAQGNIIGKNLRGMELEQKLQSILQ